jgi:outer membrane receptor for ferrienterochelin and colicin
MDYNSFGAFIDNQLKINSDFFLKASLRMENKVEGNGVFFMPRTTISYIPNKHLQVSLLYGRYSQIIGDNLDIYGSYIENQSFANHYVVSFQYKLPKTTIRLESYLKQYTHLPLIEDNKTTLNGKGKSYGADLFMEDNSIADNLTTTLSYSYNHTRRRYLEYLDEVQPQYAIAHNLAVTLKYNIPQIKCILGVAENIASGRPYTDPAEPGKLQHLTKPYLSTGINVSYLASPSVIIYASVTNLFDRHNVFNYNYIKNPGADGGYIRQPVESSRDRFFYIGIFISLKKSHAYEISNF